MAWESGQEGRQEAGEAVDAAELLRPAFTSTDRLVAHTFSYVWRPRAAGSSHVWFTVYLALRKNAETTLDALFAPASASAPHRHGSLSILLNAAATMCFVMSWRAPSPVQIAPG